MWVKITLLILAPLALVGVPDDVAQRRTVRVLRIADVLGHGGPAALRGVDLLRTRVSLQLQYGLFIGIAAVSRDLHRPPEKVVELGRPRVHLGTCHECSFRPERP